MLLAANSQISSLMIMSYDSYEDVLRRCMPITTTTFSSKNERTVPKYSTPASDFSKAPEDSAPANPGPPPLTCPVPSCALVFKGKRPYGYLWRHLKRPGIHRRTGDEKDAWLHLHKIEHDKLVAAGITPAQRKLEANRVRARKVSRVARFELCARNMGITERRLVAQKSIIWEGMYTAKQSGDSIGYDAWVLLDFCTTPQDLTNSRLLPCSGLDKEHTMLN